MSHRFDFDLIVIGGGAAGLTCSTGAGRLGAKTLLIDKENRLGGDCLHYGCVPSKSLIKSANCFHVMKNSQKYGLPKVSIPSVDFKHIRDRIRNIIDTIQIHDSPEWILKNYYVETRFGQPRFLDDHTISLDSERMTSRNFVIATGTSPLIPTVEGLNSIPFLTNIDIFSLERLPSPLIVLGGGPIGCEMAQAFQRLGAQVTIIQTKEQLLPKEDKDIAEFVRTRFLNEGINVYLNAKAVKVKKESDSIELTIQHGGLTKNLKAESLLVATGRRANTEGLDLQKAGIILENRYIKVDERMRTTTQNIYACGDVTGGFQFTHVASYEAGIVLLNTIFRIPVKRNLTYIPWCTYLDPEVASVGYNEKRAREKGLAYEIYKEEFKNNDRALAEGEPDGFLKILINKRRKVIGVQMIAAHAGELIHSWVVALNGRVKLSTLAQAIFAYPTLSEIMKRASGNFLSLCLFNEKTKKILKFLFGLKGRG